MYSNTSANKRMFSETAFFEEEKIKKRTAFDWDERMFPTTFTKKQPVFQANQEATVK